MNVHFRKSIGSKFLLVVGAFVVAFSCLVLYRTWSQSNVHARDLLAQQTELALAFDVAIREYVGEHVRPFARQHVGQDKFIAKVMSTSFVARSIFEKVQRKFPQAVIKFSSANPLNPLNQASREELEILRYFEENPQAEQWSGQIDLAGRPHWALFRVQRTERRCLACHGNPQDAPKSLVQQYGEDGGFNFREGQVMAMDMVAIPNEKSRTAAFVGTAKNSLVLLIGLCLLLVAIYFAFYYLVSRKLEVISKHFRDALQSEDDSSLSTICYRGSDEVADLAASFNLLAGKLRRGQASLEDRVTERTSELETAVANLKREVEERKRVENDLQKLSVAVEQSPVTVVITDTEGTIQYVNPQFTRSTGYTAEEAVGQNPRIFKSGDMARETYRWMWETIRAGKVWRSEFHNRKKNGELYWEAASISPIVDSEGDITHFLAVKEDISERKWAEVELMQAKQEAEAANCLLEEAIQRANGLAAEATEASTAKSEFLANMSHEIRTPMTAILGFADQLLEADISDTERKSAVNTIRRNGEHLLSVINDILDISKIESGKMTFERITCSPVELLAEVKSLMQVRADAKQLDFRVECAGPLPEAIQTDPTRLRQILFNVIGNAIKFTQTGSVRLIVQFLDGQRPVLQLDIIDTGIGMTAAQYLRVFAPFVQADNSTARRFGGTGLGLALCKRLAELLDGDIVVVRSEPDQGSHFRVTLVVEPVEGVKMIEDPGLLTARSSPDPRKCDSPSGRLEGRILLAEDGPDNQRLITALLEKSGAEVTVVENGRLAADAALTARNDQTPFDLVLMDMQMPVMSGYVATAVLRRNDYHGPIVALTANAMAEDRKKCLDAGCDDYLSKPIDRNRLIDTARRYLTPKRTEEAPVNRA